MKVLDGRGKRMKTVGLKNQERIKKYFQDNPGSTKGDCVRDLGIAYSTLRRHLVALGWV